MFLFTRVPIYRRVINSDNGDEGVALLAEGLRRGRLPWLQALRLVGAQIGPQGATALASALTKRALPSLELVGLSNNHSTRSKARG